MIGDIVNIHGSEFALQVSERIGGVSGNQGGWIGGQEVIRIPDAEYQPNKAP
jgi:hypothetical protein